MMNGNRVGPDHRGYRLTPCPRLTVGDEVMVFEKNAEFRRDHPGGVPAKVVKVARVNIMLRRDDIDHRYHPDGVRYRMDGQQVDDVYQHDTYFRTHAQVAEMREIDEAMAVMAAAEIKFDTLCTHLTGQELIAMAETVRTHPAFKDRRG